MNDTQGSDSRTQMTLFRKNRKNSSSSMSKKKSLAQNMGLASARVETLLTDEEAKMKLPVLLDEYIDARCKLKKSCRKSDFDEAARDALRKVGFLHALQTVETFAMGPSRIFPRRSMELSDILQLKEKYWAKSKFAAEFKGGAAGLLSLPSILLVAIADVSIRGSCFPSDFTPEVCFELHNLKVNLAINAVLAFNSNKRICAGNRGGILNRARFFLQLIHNIGKQSSLQSLERVRSRNFDVKPKNSLVSLEVGATPTSKLSIARTSSSSQTKSPSHLDESSSDSLTVSNAKNIANKDPEEDDSAKIRLDELTIDGESLCFVKNESGTLLGLNLDTAKNGFAYEDLAGDDRPLDAKSLISTEIDARETMTESALSIEIDHNYNFCLGTNSKVDDPGSIPSEDDIDHAQLYQSQQQFFRLPLASALDCWESDSNDQFGHSLKSAPNYAIDDNCSLSSPVDRLTNDRPRQWEPGYGTNSSVVGDRAGCDIRIGMERFDIKDIRWQHEQSPNMESSSKKDDWSGSDLDSCSTRFHCNPGYESATASALYPQRTSRDPKFTEIIEEVFLKEMRLLREKIELQEKNGRGLGEEVVRLRALCMELQKEILRLNNERKTLTASLGELNDLLKQNNTRFRHSTFKRRNRDKMSIF